MSVARQEKKLMTAEELWNMPEVPGKRFELVDGELVDMPGAGVRHAQIVRLLLFLLYPFVSERGLGEVFGDGLGYVIEHNPDRMRIPDVSFIARDRLPEGELPEGFWDSAPDLAVEVVSPSDSANAIHDKVREYLEAGVRLVWVLWPRSRSISVYSHDGGFQELRSDDELDGGDVLPGFSAQVSRLFETGQ